MGLKKRTKIGSKTFSNGLGSSARSYMNESLNNGRPAEGPEVSAVPPVKQTIAYGTESGGMFDWLQDKYKGESDREDYVNKDGSYKFAASHKKAVADAEAILKSSKGVDKEDSYEMSEVKRALRKLNASLAASVPQGREEFMVALARINFEYDWLLSSCSAYIDHIKEDAWSGISSLGRERMRLVKSVKAKYQREYAAFAPTAKAAFRSGTDLSGKAWEDFFNDVKTDSLDLINSKIKGHGGSALFTRKNDDDDLEFIKVEEATTQVDQAKLADNFVSYKGGMQMFGPLIVRIREFYLKNNGKGDGVDFDNYFRNFIYGYVETRKTEAVESKADAVDKLRWKDDISIKLIDYIYSDPGLQKMFERMIAYTAMTGAVSYEAGNADNEEGYAVTNRNEATSLMADKMGISDLIAKSETRVFDQGGGSIARANVMQAAKGISFEDLKKKAAAAKRDDKIDVTIEYTPNSLMQLFCLEIFDLMCGQIDRHDGNYFCVYDVIDREIADGKPKKQVWSINSIQGIDNDASFGTMDLDSLQIDNANTNHKGISFFSQAEKGNMKKGKLTITFLPETFYNNLMKFSPYDATLELVDTRGAGELKALEKRIIGVKETVRELVESGQIVLVKDGDEKAAREQFERTRDIASYDDTVPKDTWNRVQMMGVEWKYLRRNKELIKRDKKNK